MAGLQFNFTGNNKTLLKNIAQVQNALTAMSNELESNGENFTKFFNQAAKGGVDLTKALSGDAKELEKLAKTMKANLNEMQAAWDNLTDEMKSSGLGKVMAEQMQQAAQMTDQVSEKIEQSGNSANKAAGGYNGIAVQMQMLAREVPNLANSFSIFMMAIGNNLPMLADEIERANKEIEIAKKAGKSFTPVWQQMIGAVFNWQTGLILAVTALTMFGDKIPDIIKKISGMNKAILSTTEMQEAINKSLKENTGSYAEQMTELSKLQSGWKSLGGDMKKQEKFIIENKDAFDKLNVSVKNVNDAENLLVTNTDAFINALSKKAEAEANYSLATEKFQEAREKELEALKQETEGVSFLDKSNAALANQGYLEAGSSTRVTAQGMFEARIQRLKDEAEEARTTARAYIGLGDAKKKEADKTKEDAGIKDSENKALEEEKKRLQELQQAKDAYLQKQRDYEQALKEARTKGAKAATDAMEEGYLKQEEMMKAAHRAELEEIDKQKAELLKRKTDVAKAKAEAEGNKNFKVESVQLSKEEEQIFKDRIEDTRKKQENELKAFNETLDKMLQAATMANASQLEQQLFDIDTYYQEKIKLAQGKEELLTQLTKNWAAERAKAENESRLRENQQAETKALMKTDNTYLGTGLTEKAEKEKTQILIDYAKERIEILRALGDEQSQAEAETLAKQVEAYNKQLKQPMSVKGWFDSNVFDKLEKKYLELGETQEEAKKKASGFFAGLQNGASKTIDAVGLLQTAFGGLDENLDKALNAIGSVASGFASGGLVGGIASATGVIMQSLKSLGAADYSQYKKLVEEYDSLLDVWDTLIEKKTEYINIDFGDEARKAGEEAEELVKRQIKAYEELGKARLDSGGGWFSHTIGVRTKKNMSQSGWDELKKAASEIGFNYKDVVDDRMKGLFDLTAEQLEDLQAKAPTFWAQLDEEARGYLENIIACQDEIEKMKDSMNEATTGVSFDSFYDSFVSTLSDMDSDSEDFAENFGNYLEKAIISNMVAEKYRDRVRQLYESWVTMSDSNGDTYFDLTSEETAELQAAQKALADAMLAERDAIMSAFGWTKEDTKESVAEYEDFVSNIKGSLMSIDLAAKDVSNNIYDYFRQAMVNALYDTKYKPLMEQLLKDYKQLISDGNFNEADLNKLSKGVDVYVNQMTEEVEKVNKLFADILKESQNDKTLEDDFKSFSDNLLNSLYNVKATSEDISKDMGDTMREALIKAMYVKNYEPQMKKWYKAWQKAMGDGDLSAGEKASLDSMKQSIINDAMKEVNAINQMFESISSQTKSQQATSKSFSAMSQETGEELNGRFTAFQISNETIRANTKQIAETINLVLSYMPQFDGVLNDMLSGQSIANSHLEMIEKYTKEIKSFGDILRSIADNTKNL